MIQNDDVLHTLPDGTEEIVTIVSMPWSIDNWTPHYLIRRGIILDTIPHNTLRPLGTRPRIPVNQIAQFIVDSNEDIPDGKTTIMLDLELPQDKYDEYTQACDDPEQVVIIFITSAPKAAE